MFQTYDITSCDHGHMPLHCSKKIKLKLKEKKRKIKSRKINKMKRKSK